METKAVYFKHSDTLKLWNGSVVNKYRAVIETDKEVFQSGELEGPIYHGSTVTKYGEKILDNFRDRVLFWFDNPKADDMLREHYVGESYGRPIYQIPGGKI